MPIPAAIQGVSQLDRLIPLLARPACYVWRLPNHTTIEILTMVGKYRVLNQGRCKKLSWLID